MRRATASIVLLSLLVACSSSADGSGSSPTITVFAASSLTAAFTKIGSDYEAANPGTDVTFDFGSSTDLAAQIQSEGTADVFASASSAAMDTVASDPGVTDRADFVTNRLVVVTPPGNPGGVGSIRDLAAPGVQVILGAVGVPVGDYARQALQNAGVAEEALANVVSNEEDDASIVAKISAGEADAAIVYTSDVTTASGLRSVPIPDAVNVVATYPIAVVSGTSQTAAARAFVRYVTGPSGQATLRGFGFGPGTR